MHVQAGTLDHHLDHVEWFNLLWDQRRKASPAPLRPVFAVAEEASEHSAARAGHRLAAATRAAILARDIAEIEKIRDALDAQNGFRRHGSVTLFGRRSTDASPVVLGTVVGGVLFSFFAAAAGFMKFAR